MRATTFVMAAVGGLRGGVLRAQHVEYGATAEITRHPASRGESTGEGSAQC